MHTQQHGSLAEHTISRWSQLLYICIANVLSPVW
jgi:hypothetical protein